MVPAEVATDPSTLRRALAIAGSVSVRLAGGSMGPLIANGAKGRVVRCGLAELRRFDVAVYERHGRLIAHVVDRVDAEGVHPSSLTGDPERPLGEGEVLGRIEGLVLRRRCLRVPRGLARAVVGVVRGATRRLLRTR